MLDGIYLEKVGIPASVICTEPFLGQGTAIASAHGFQNYPLVLISHPLATASSEELLAEAERVVDDVVNLLLV